LEGQRILSEIEEKLYMSDVYQELSPTQKKSLAFLKSELSDGSPREVVELQRKARSKGIPTRSLTASRKMLQVAVFRESQRGKFYWQMQDEVIK
jgi:hypothetical protein